MGGIGIFPRLSMASNSGSTMVKASCSSGVRRGMFSLLVAGWVDGLAKITFRLELGPGTLRLVRD